jgi:hypothetical protein
MSVAPPLDIERWLPVLLHQEPFAISHIVDDENDGSRRADAHIHAHTGLSMEVGRRRNPRLAGDLVRPG